MITILVADDQALIRAGICEILTSRDDYAVSEAIDGVSALEYLRVQSADVVLLDIRMPGIDGIETTRRIREEHGPSRPRILVLTTFEHDDAVVQAVSAGADGFVGKGIEPEQLIAAIAEVHEGKSLLSSAATDALVRHVATGRTTSMVDHAILARFESLTARELEIVVAVARGRTGEQIASDEQISPYTVKTHISRALTKVAAADRAQLVALAYRAGLLT